MSKNVILTDVNDEQILPITTSENVFVGEGVTLKETLENLSGGGSAVVVDKAMSETSENPVQNKVISAKLNEVFQSVSNGKTLVASAITDRGVETDAEATFETIADNISKIFDISKSPMHVYDMYIENGVIYPNPSYYGYFRTTIGFKPDSQTWEIGIKILLTDRLSVSQVLFGSNRGFYESPTLQVQADGSLWAGVTNNSSQWSMTGQSGSSKILELNTWYYIKFFYDGSSYHVDVSTDGEEWERFITFSAIGLTRSTNSISFNTIANSHDHVCKYVHFDLRNVYFTINNALIWGNVEV